MCFMYRLRSLQSGGKHDVSLDFIVVCQVLLHVLEILLYSDAGRGRLHSAFSEVLSSC